MTVVALTTVLLSCNNCFGYGEMSGSAENTHEIDADDPIRTKLVERTHLSCVNGERVLGVGVGTPRSASAVISASHGEVSRSR